MNSETSKAALKSNCKHVTYKNKTSEQEALQNQVVMDLVKNALLLNNYLTDFKRRALNDVVDLVSITAQRYEVKICSKSGCVNLTSSDGKYKIERSIAGHLLLSEKLESAKARILECVAQWPISRRKNGYGLVAYAFKTNQVGQIQTQSVIELLQLKIDDENWRHAMALLKGAIIADNTASQICIYERMGITDQYQMIPLDIAAVKV